MEHWLAEKLEQFERDWPKAAAAIRALERDFDLRMLDVHPGNIMLHPINPSNDPGAQH